MRSSLFTGLVLRCYDEKEMFKTDSKIKIMTIITVVALALAGYSYLNIYFISSRVEGLISELASTTASFIKKTDQLSQSIAALEQKELLLADELSATDQNVKITRTNVETVQSKVGGVEKTVGTLEKLSKTDPELLQKYSKIFFLNEHYAPERLAEIDKAYLYSERKTEIIHSLVWPHLKDMLESAKLIGLTLYVKSAYRSFEEQKSVKSTYTVVYGKGSANQFSADQGYSEHQLGTTADFTTADVNGSLSGFEKTPAYLWMQLNAYKYGFVLSYPKNNSYYIFEPWHWRYVGIALATRLKEEGKYFYDLDQREIDKYLVNIFD